MKNKHRVCFIRADASSSIGIGHVMRCMALALAFKKKGVQCHFVCQTLPDNVANIIRSQGFLLTLLPTADSGSQLVHEDEILPISALLDEQVAEPILVVDHYGIDQLWESRIRQKMACLTVIDDLANRRHDCHVLMDQTLNRSEQDYIPLVAGDTEVLTGTSFALLRPEFAATSGKAKELRSIVSVPHKVLINFGGGTADLYVGQCLKVLSEEQFRDLEITLIAPDSTAIREVVQSYPRQIKHVFYTENMHEYYLDADLAIGAAGSSSWERCCLGLPSISFVIAENQRMIAMELEREGATKLIDNLNVEGSLCTGIQELLQPSIYQRMSQRAFEICDGKGADRLAERILNQVSNAIPVS